MIQLFHHLYLYLQKIDLMDIREIYEERIAVYSHDTRNAPRASILLVHGLGEHSGRYNEWAERFVSEGIAFRAFDLPGHGLSGGKRGVMPDYGRIFLIIENLIEGLGNDFPGVPVFLYGHSLGGGLVLSMLIKNTPPVTGAIVTSPWVRLTEEPPALKVWLAGISKKIIPGLTQKSGLKTKYLSHDPQVVAAYEHDPLVHGLISAGLFSSATEAAEEILKHASEIELPLLLIHGRDDMIASPSGTIEVAGAAPRATLKLWDGAYHEVHNDIMRDEHFDFILEWINTLL